MARMTVDDQGRRTCVECGRKFHVSADSRLETCAQCMAQRGAVQRGLIPLGTKLEGFGTVVQVSLTAYLVEWSEPCQYGSQRRSEWLSFDAVHGRPAAATPLVVFS